MSLPDCFTTVSERPVALRLLTAAQLPEWLSGQPEAVRRWVTDTGFSAEAGQHCPLPGPGGALDQVLWGLAGDGPDTWTLGEAPRRLPAGDYRLAGEWDRATRTRLALGWALGAYRFTRYRKDDDRRARLLLEDVDEASLLAQVDAVGLVRDLINTPPDDMMPPQLAAAARALAARFEAGFSEIVGDALLDAGYPAIHAVGRASVHPPRLLRLTWGAPDRPLLALVGKGVCFDSGGLDIKPAKGMRLMQKDMGGAAHVLGLASLIMASRLPVRLLVLVPAVENAVSGNAFHPGDILSTCQGLTVEIENTDAEGRLVLADALTEASRQGPDLIVDFATLTGAARVAVGTEIAAFFSNRPAAIPALQVAAEASDDPVWPLPLHAPYRDQLKSRVADLLNCSSGPYGGAITAALFLERFVGEGIDWLHFDVMAWNTRQRPGRPEGGEAMGLRAVFEWLRARYGAR